MLGLVLAVFVPSVTSDAVMVLVPSSVLWVTLSLLVPPTRAMSAFTYTTLFRSARWTVSVMVLTRFQLASTALMVTENWVPAVAALGVPVLPVALPGSADLRRANI